MLKQLIITTCRKIADLSPQRDLEAMRTQIGLARPDLLASWNLPPNLPPETSDLFRNAIAESAIVHVRSAGVCAEDLANTLGAPSVPLPHQLLAAAVLAYLAKPDDLIPDHTPGGYGFIDDAILLRVGYEQVFRQAPNGETATNNQVIDFLARLIAPAVLAQLGQAIHGLQALLQMLAALPPFAQQVTLQQIIANPLAQMNNYPAPVQPGFRPTTPPMPFIGRSGAIIEGNNIAIPGGPSLINGQLYIPR